MKLWRIYQVVNHDYDTYDSAVVAAETEKDALFTHPRLSRNPWDGRASDWDEWCDVEDVKIEYLGEARPGIQAGVVVASFNAG